MNDFYSGDSEEVIEVAPHRPSTAAEFSAAARASVSDAEAATLIQHLRSAPEASAVLDEIAASKSVDDRMWVAWAAPRVLGDGAIPVLKRLAGDRDADVRIDAIEAWATLHPNSAAELWPFLRRQLQSTNFWEPISAMWAIAEIDLRDAIPAIRERAHRWPKTDAHWKVADIVLDLLEGRQQPILERIRQHDHIAMPWLARAARLMNTTEANDTLAWGFDAFRGDERCHAACSET
jgi:hypothetical protein